MPIIFEYDKHLKDGKKIKSNNLAEKYVVEEMQKFQGKDKLFYFTPINAIFWFGKEEIDFVIKNLNTKKAISWDLVHPAYIKETYEKSEIFQQQMMFELYNMISFGNIERYKVSRLMLLKKKEEEYLGMKDLRPIQINSVMIKILEKLILNRLKEEKNLIHKR